MKYKQVVIGGTFDHFHAGHKALLEKAFLLGDHVDIGLTKEEMTREKKLRASILPYMTRYKNLIEFLSCYDLRERGAIIPIQDKYGKTLIEEKYEAIIVSPETKKTALEINVKRKSKGLPEMKIIVVPFVRASDKKSITSERIRMGEIDRDGKVYSLPKNSIKMPESLRVKLRVPLGKVFPSTAQVVQFLKKNDPVLVISVGDIITKSLLDREIFPDISIVDFSSRREKLEPYQLHVVQKHTKNSAGVIHPEIEPLLKESIDQVIKTKEKSAIVVDGEEDLLTLPALLFAPLGTVILYGQYDKGVIGVEVTEEMKKKVNDLLGLFQ